MQSWARQDPQAAATWLSSQPQGSNRDMAVKRFAESASSSEPQLAWQWAMTIRDPGRRREALERVAPSYMRINGADARNEIQNSGLPADVLDRLLKSKE